MFHATLEHNSYIFRPNLLPTSSRVLQSEEVALAVSVVPNTSADLWQLRLGHLNYGDMCKLRGRSTGMAFVGEMCFCQTCVLAKMRRLPYQNKRQINVLPKQNVCFDVSGPFLHLLRVMFIHSMRYAKLRARGGGKEVKLSQTLLLFLPTLYCV